MDVLSAATGAAILGACYFLFRVARDGVPAVLGWVRGKLRAGRDELASLGEDIDHLHDRFDALERRVAELGRAGQVGTTGGTAPAPAAPSFLTPERG